MAVLLIRRRKEWKGLLWFFGGILLLLPLYKRYIPVRGLTRTQSFPVSDNIAIIDVRDYQAVDGAPAGHLIRIPYAYLHRKHHEIPKKPLHLVASDELTRNLSVRYLRKKGFIVQSYCLASPNC